MSEQLSINPEHIRYVTRGVACLTIAVGSTSVGAYFYYKGKDAQANALSEAAIVRNVCVSVKGWEETHKTPLSPNDYEVVRDTLYYPFPDRAILENVGPFHGDNSVSDLKSNVIVHQPLRFINGGDEWIGFYDANEPRSNTARLSCLSHYVWIDFTHDRKVKQAALYPPAAPKTVEFGSIRGGEVLAPDGQRAAYAETTDIRLPDLFFAANQ